MSFNVEVKYNLDMKFIFFWHKISVLILGLWYEIIFLFDFGVTYDLDNFLMFTRQA